MAEDAGCVDYDAYWRTLRRAYFRTVSTVAEPTVADIWLFYEHARRIAQLAAEASYMDLAAKLERPTDWQWITNWETVHVEWLSIAAQHALQARALEGRDG